jgi:transposase
VAQCLASRPTHLGLDVRKDTISVAILAPDRDGPEVERIPHDEPSVRRLVGRLGDPRWLRACYEAGPTGYDLARLLESMRVRCQVIAPSLIPKAPGDKVKTDRRDCRRLARLHRAGELVAIRVPTVQEEAVRDLCRARADMVQDRTRARHRLSMFLLRHGRPWRGGNAWTLTHERWLGSQRFDQPALRATTGTTGPRSTPGMPPWPPSRPTWPAGMTGRRSPTPCTAWPPTGASPGWEP